MMCVSCALFNKTLFTVFTYASIVAVLTNTFEIIVILNALRIMHTLVVILWTFVILTYLNILKFNILNNLMLKILTILALIAIIWRQASALKWTSIQKAFTIV